MSAPYLAGPMLVIPVSCDDRYRWWDDRIPDRLSVHQIREELGAEPEHHLRYCRRGEDPCRREEP